MPTDRLTNKQADRHTDALISILGTPTRDEVNIPNVTVT